MNGEEPGEYREKMRELEEINSQKICISTVMAKEGVTADAAVFSQRRALDLTAAGAGMAVILRPPMDAKHG